jgi:hypothetical protein
VSERPYLLDLSFVSAALAWRLAHPNVALQRNLAHNARLFERREAPAGIGRKADRGEIFSGARCTSGH